MSTRPPEQLAARSRYSFRQAYESGGFLQRDLMSVGKLHTEARKRGISLGVTSHSAAEFLEELDEKGAFCPIAFVKRGTYVRTGDQALLGRPALVFRERRKFTTWSTYAAVVDGSTVPTALFSPWQLLYLSDALDLRAMPVHIEALADPEASKRWATNSDAWVQAQYRRWQELDSSWRRLLLLLVRLQNRYWPFVGSFTLPLDPETRGYLDAGDLIADERRRFNAQETLEEQGLTIEGVRGFYENLSFAIQREDPIPEWWVLRRLARRHDLERMKSSARQVEDVWEAATVLRLFYRELTGEILPDTNAVGKDPEYTERVLGHEPRLEYDRSDLRRFLDRHELYPHRVQVFAEGDSEEIMLKGLLSHLHGSPEDEGIRINRLEGVGNMHRRQRDLIHALQNYSRDAVLVADREGAVGRYVSEWKRAGLLDEGNDWLWTRSLEEDNFSPAELVRAAKSA